MTEDIRELRTRKAVATRRESVSQFIFVVNDLPDNYIFVDIRQVNFGE